MTIPVKQRVPNTTLRAIRLGLRMSQGELAAAVRRAGDALGEPNQCNKRLVQKWESGEHTDVRPNYKRALSAATRVPFEQLGFSAASPVSGVPVPLVAVRVARTGARGTDGQTGESADRLRFALERPGHADETTASNTDTAVERLFALERSQPARVIARAVDRQVEQIAALLAGTSRTSTRRRLAAQGGACAALAGWLAFDTGDAVAAHRFWDGALDAARYAADGPLLSCVLVFLSFSAAERGDPATGWQLAHSAATHASGQARMRAWALGRAAIEAARLGEHTAALEELHPALELLPQLAPAAPGDGTAPWARFLDAAYLEAMAAEVFGQLGEHEQALEHAHAAMATVGFGRTKARALVLAQVACTAAQNSDMQLASQYAFEAADLADTLESSLAWRKLRLLATLIRPYRATVPAERLAQRLDTLLD